MGLADWTALEAALEALLAEDGFELVRLDRATGRGARLALFVDRAGAPGTITLDDCAEVSRRVSRWLDVEDPFRGSYRLLVSSPGVDRPLTKLAHCAQFVGRQVQIRHRLPTGQRQTVEGQLVGLEGETLTLEVDGAHWTVDWPAVLEARLVHQWDD